MKTIQLNGYQVNFLAELSALAEFFPIGHYSRHIIFCDERTRAYCLPQLMEALPVLHKAVILEIPSGEEYKTLQTCEKLWEELIELQIDRKALLINLGGGVIGDMGGMVASLYKRGINFIQIPTTLLAQVDATVGGKTGINFGGVKNSIGLFADPRAVFIYTPFLKTLSEQQLLSGFAEMLKHALISSDSLWKRLIQVTPLTHESWDDLIYESLLIKADIVQKDPLEKGLRKVLNFGHTLGHAIEALSLKQEDIHLLHGHAVALGMIGECWLSGQKLGFPTADVQKITAHLLKLYRPYFNIELNIDKLLRLAGNDKKNQGGQISCVLLEKTGKPVINVQCSDDEIRQAFKYLRDLI